jgi:hypothetical protein
MQTAAEAFMPMWILLIVGAGIVIGALLAAFGVVLAVAGFRSQPAGVSLPDAAPCPKCGAVVPLTKRTCPSCGAQVG